MDGIEVEEPDDNNNNYREKQKVPETSRCFENIPPRGWNLPSRRLTHYVAYLHSFVILASYKALPWFPNHEFKQHGEGATHTQLPTHVTLVYCYA